MKKWWSYIQYFFFLGLNWNFPLAFFIVKREISGEKKLNHYVSGTDDLTSSVGESDRSHASIYQPINFYTATRLFEQLTPEDKQCAFLDAGCGKGRGLALAAAYGLQKIYGFDISAAMCLYANESLTPTLSRYPDALIVIDQANAKKYKVPDDVGVIFLFNPFDKAIMTDFAKQVALSLKRNPRKIKLLYANPVDKDIWLSHGFIEIFTFKKMEWLEGSILQITPP